MLAGQSFRLKLALIVGVPSVVALIGSLLALNRVVASYGRARTLETANASSTDLIRAAAAQAKERGFTSAALSDPEAQTARQALPGLRTEGDFLLDTALAEAQPALRGNAVLSAAHRQLLEARHARDAGRAAADADLALRQRIDQARVQSWFDAQTRLILAERVFGSTLFLAQNPYELVIQYNGYIKGNVFVASEFAGRERARIGRIIAGGKSIPPEGLSELQRWRGVVDENLTAIAQLRANPAMSGSVLASIGHMEDVFLGEYENTRESVYLASAHGEPYPLTTDEWIVTSTRAIDSILAVSDRIPRRLSLERALAIRAVLINGGIPSTRIFARALGAVPGDDAHAEHTLVAVRDQDAAGAFGPVSSSAAAIAAATGAGVTPTDAASSPATATGTSATGATGIGTTGTGPSATGTTKSGPTTDASGTARSGIAGAP